jgi:argininosuccinate lyase
LTYNRDHQEDKAAIFSSGDTIYDCLQVMTPMIKSLSLDEGKLLLACQQGFPTAIDAADVLVQKGMPFREAHVLVGRIVSLCAKQKKTLESLTLAEWKIFSALFSEEVLERVKLGTSITSKKSLGSTHPNLVNRVLEKWEKQLKSTNRKR